MKLNKIGAYLGKKSFNTFVFKAFYVPVLGLIAIKQNTAGFFYKARRFFALFLLHCIPALIVSLLRYDRIEEQIFLADVD